MPVEQHKEKNYPKDARSIYEAALDALECKLMFGAPGCDVDGSHMVSGAPRKQSRNPSNAVTTSHLSNFLLYVKS